MCELQNSNKAIVRRFNLEFIQGGNCELFDEIISPDFVNHSVPPDTDAGPEGARNFFAMIRSAFPDLVVTIHDQVAEGAAVVTRKSYQATHAGNFMGIAATGRRIQFSVIDIIRLRDGRYIEHWANADMFGLMGQLR